MPIWLNLLLTILLYLMMLSLGLVLLNLKIRFHHLIFIAIPVGIINVGLEHWFSNPFIKAIIPIFIMIGLYSYLSKVNLHKSAIAIIMGVNVCCFFESITMLTLYNLLKIYPEVYINPTLINTFGSLFIVILCLGINALIKIYDWKLYNWAQIADNSQENEPILTTALLIIGIPLLIYSFITWLTVYTTSLTANNIALILNIANALFLLYFFAICYSLRRTEHAMEKIFRAKLNNSVLTLLHQFFESQLQMKEDLASKINSISNLIKQGKYSGIHEQLYAMQDYVRPKEQIDFIPIIQLRLFFDIEQALAQERDVDFILHVSDLSGLEAYVDDAFLRMLKHLYENAFEAVESAECKEIYSEIAKDDDGGFTLIIKNNGDVLPSGHQSKPFKLGYTTKNSPDRGHGLYKVKKLIDYYQGSIDLRGSDGYTQVTIKLPFKEDYKPIPLGTFARPMLTLVKNYEK